MPRPQAYWVELTDEERGLVKRVQRATPSMGIRCRCAALLNADGPRGAERTYAELASMSGVAEPTAIAALRDFREGGVTAADARVKLKRFHADVGRHRRERDERCERKAAGR